jgi:hypothetical protein
MRGADISQPLSFITPTVEDFVPANHPLRAMRKLVDEALRDLDAHFNRLYADEGRESVAPERHVAEDRHHLVVAVNTEPAASVTERTAALAMLGDIPGDHRITVDGD